jgi:hypothetical protein
MRRTENAGFWAESYEILQAMATETSGSPSRINHFTVVQAGLLSRTSSGSLECRRSISSSVKSGSRG